MIEAPAIRTQSLPVELPELAGYDLLCVDVAPTARASSSAPQRRRDLAGVRVAAMGPGTAER